VSELLIVAGSYTGRFPHGGRMRRVLDFARDGGRPVRAAIHLLGFDPATGRVRVRSELDGIRNASWLAVHPTAGVVYAVSETQSGGVNAVTVGPGDGVLRVLNRRPSAGDLPCYVTIDAGGQWLYVANYGSGTISLHPVEDRFQVGASAQVLRHMGSGPNRSRQKSAHPHAVVLSPDGRFALVPDLGLDRVFVYDIDRATGRLRAHGQVSVQPGAGPRHLAFHTTRPFVYVVNELDCTVTSFAWNAEAGTLNPCAAVSSLPAGWRGPATAADIQVHPSGRAAYISNRGHDSIAVIATEPDGTMRYIDAVPSGGSTPRSFTLDPSGRFLLVAHQDTDLVATFAVHARTGALKALCRSVVPASVCIKYVPVP
jgi:6-phosphogluconolactonase